MNTRRTLTTFLFAVLGLALAAPAVAQSDGDPIADRWVQGDDVDQIYADVPAPSRDLRVEVWHENETDDRAYRRGESYELYFETNGDAYVVVYRIDVEGEVEVLWPTSRYDDGFVYGNHTYTLPRTGSPVRLTAGQRKGVEYVQVIASELPFDLRRLSIDFRFDLNDRTDYRYAIAGDPFLAVNDINFAITGLEEDVDYVVTDWAHLYVEQHVDYARYTCNQCHDGGGEAYTTNVRPYVDTCTTINVYADYGWQRRWYVDIGWYPLYYEPIYYYWDPYYGRPYWFSYYPVYYRWPSYPVYVRPYRWYAWNDSPWYRGDYRVRYKSHGGTRLYDFDRIKTRTRDVPGLGEVASGGPASITRIRGGAADGRLSKDRLVKDRTPTMVRSDLKPRSEDRVARDRTRVGIRDDRRVTRDERRLTSLAPQRDTSRGSVDRTTRGGGTSIDRESSRNERRWTRPVIRNEDRSTRDRTSIQRDRGTSTRRESTIDRSRTTRDRIERNTAPSRPKIDRNTSRERKVTPQRSTDRKKNTPERNVRPSTPPRTRDKVDRPSSPSRPTRQKATPQRSAPKRESSNSGGSKSRSSGGGSKSRQRGGGGGRG